MRVQNWQLKVAMAITGGFWALFVLIHLFGNLKAYQGPEHFNGYAHWLRHAFYPLMPEEGVLWALRILLIISLIIHVAAATTLFMRARRARGKFRAKKRNAGTMSLSAKLMPLTGVVILAFLIIHVLDLTIGTKPIAPESFTGHTAEASMAYSNLVASFSRWYMALVYVVTMVLLAIHIAHGARTMATDLGVMGKRLTAVFVWVGAAAALAIVLGNASLPIAVQMGWLS